MRNSPGNAGLRAETLEELRRQLDSLRAELRSEASAELREIATPAAERGEDTTPSRMDVARDVANREELIERELKQAGELAEIEDALARMANGLYGRCADCGREIPLERLRVRPHASRDAACQGRLDHSRQVG